MGKEENVAGGRPFLLAVIIPTWDLAKALRMVDDLVDLENGIDDPHTHYIIVSQQAENAKGDEGKLIAESTRAFPYLDVIHTRPLLPTQAMAYGGLAAMVKGADALAFFHDDVTLLEGWDVGVVDLFRTQENVGLVGFGGATGLGTSGLYHDEYEIPQLARINFLSNLTDWETHGGRLLNAMPCAVLDGFAQILSRDAYEQIGGWEAAIDDGIHFHMYDAWLACRMVELGLATWMVPVRCRHQGGGTSVSHSDAYERLCRENGYANGQDLYNQAHRRIYDRFRPILPFRVNPVGDVDTCVNGKALRV